MTNEQLVANLVISKDQRATTTSLTVAEVFEKRHADVLRAVENLECSDDFTKRNFAFCTKINELQNGKPQPYVEMTRDGFVFLAMGFTGKEAAQWKEKFISAFNAMEQQLQKNIIHTDTILERCLAMLTENQTVLQQVMSSGFSAVNFRIDGLDNKVDRMNTAVTGLAAEVFSLAQRGRRRIKDSVKAEIAKHTDLLGQRCPCCGINEVIAKETVNRFAEFDHFYQNSLPDANHIWLICKPCHTELTTGRIQRGDRQAEFNAFQAKCQRLPGAQPILQWQAA